MEKVKRLISWYDKSTEECVDEKDISNIAFKRLKEIFPPPSEDPFLIRPIAINEVEAERLKEMVNIEFFFQKYDYFLECFKATP